MTLCGDATHRSVLERAEVNRADAFVAVAGSDADNVVAASLAKVVGAKLSVARVDDPGFFRQGAAVETGVLGIDAALCKPRLATSQLVERMLSTSFTLVDSFALYGVRAGLIAASRAPSVVGRSPEALDLPAGVAIEGVVRDGYLRVPSDVPRLSAEDQLLVVGSPLPFLDLWLELDEGVVHERTMIVGGGEIGAEIARRLGRRIDRVELVETDRARATELSASLPDVSVIVGDARRAELLEDLQARSVRHLLTTTQSDEVNLLVSLLARRFGVPNTYTLVHQPGYSGLFRDLGIGGAIGIYEVLARAVSEAIAAGQIVRTRDLDGTGYAISEFRFAPATHETPLARIADVPIPPRCRVIGATHRYEIIETNRGAELCGGDTLLILGPRRDVADVRTALTKFDRSLER